MIDKEIIKIASNTENHGVLDNHTHFSKLKNAICGDEMKVYIMVDNNKIINLKYECESCIYCQASVSLLSTNIKNKSVEKVKIFAHHAKNYFITEIPFDKEWKDFNKILTKSNISRKDCLLLPINTVLSALTN
ncbi:MAG: iron-sulfur cluster assembly scaffold protein [Candidatus Pelagibacter sp. TMED64]|nr:iron-sulfur cluster assembly scaffold protein [Candidatus Pelagibacter sp.]OUU65942.1 MAG: iron-sulfur cluster assembly scaffold protein [Candidatus Pelagibacter sp. TMED64]|tara:strand:- start:3426 stop:3824 length:399 start_codon:yes stop_codon:yes gene_type:complete